MLPETVMGLGRAAWFHYVSGADAAALSALAAIDQPGCTIAEGASAQVPVAAKPSAQ
jgi:hypothetical protein